MNVRNLSRNVPLHIKATWLTVEIRLRLLMRKFLLFLLVLALVVMALVFVNLALYRAMEFAWGPVWTPSILAGGNLVLALVVAIVAALASPGQDLAIAEELRTSTAAAIQEDLRVGNDGLGLASGIASGDSARFIVPIISLILGALRRGRKSETK